MAKGGSSSFNILIGRLREAMRNPITVLKCLREKSCDKTYKYKRLYRNLYNPEIFLLAYNNIYASPGNMTAGVDGQTVDGMSLQRIEKIITSLKDHSYQPTPARRVYIEKRNSSKKRPLGIPSTDDKLVQEAVRMILEAIYEPTFSDCSHGFRPQRSCHTALKSIDRSFIGTKWFIEGDIKSCFDCFDHEVLINILRKRIHDEYFIALMWKFLRAGYMEQWQYHKTYSGTPQGSGISPILANIYLNELDSFIMEYKAQFEIRGKRKASSEYERIRSRYKKRKAKYARNWDSMTEDEKKRAKQEVCTLKREMQNTPYTECKNERLKTLQYVRYADDWIIGVIGSKEDAEKIKSDIGAFLQKHLKLELSQEKTKVTHAGDFARFLSYDITINHSQSLKRNKNGVAQRVWNGKVKMYVPREKWEGKLREYQAFYIQKDKNGKEYWKPTHRGQLVNRDDIEIISKYNAEIRGIYNYYCLADNVSVLNNFAHIMEYSMYSTFARKYEIPKSAVIAKYCRDGVFGVNYQTRTGVKRCTFYNDGFKKQVIPNHPAADTLPQYVKYERANSVAGRLKRHVCELCGAEQQEVYMHHVRKLKDLSGESEWEQLMIEKRRKTLAVCKNCYAKITK